MILGSGTAIPTPRRANTGLVLAVDGDVTLIDPGPGSLKRACDAGFPVETIRRVLLTHHHVDHCLDVIALLFARKNPVLAEMCEPLEILGGKGTIDLLERFRHVFGGWVTLPEGQLAVRELEPGPFRLSDQVEGRASAMAHTPASLGYRLSTRNGSSVAFSGDTEPCDGALEIGRDTDHYLIEAAMPDDQPVQGHLTPRLAAELVQRSGARHLILTHFYPPVDVEMARAVAKQCFAGPVTIAEDGLRVQLEEVTA